MRRWAAVAAVIALLLSVDHGVETCGQKWGTSRGQNSRKMGDENVRVAVRMRPFNDREKKMGAKCCITMDKATQMTAITNAEDGG